ncbi:LysR family transcriptional regulator [Thioclava sp. GXIMD4216]|uniref:winged helix-turn-helix domain-containing protein n=1 Tax=Thioclava sp. GXIMD4216 TaxID=3131929 RepID=UPI0030CE6AD2
MPPNRIALRLYWDPIMMGPGKADLLQAIAEEGSISAAGRRMGMSYRRAWALVEEMNAGFCAPVVSSARGGTRGGGAHLTETGTEVLRLYRQLLERFRESCNDDIAALEALTGPRD